MSDRTPVVKVSNLKKYFEITKGAFVKRKLTVKAVDGVSFELLPGETLGLVGESGSGKTTVGLTTIRVYLPTEGRIFLDGVDITFMKEKELRVHRRKIGVVFQNPYASLNPRMSILDIVSEPIKLRGEKLSREEMKELVIKALQDAGLPGDMITRYPHELSGGQRQRVAIARAIISKPKFILLDEPTSSLDVSVQASVLNTLKDIQQKYQMAYLFISHDLSVVRFMAHKVAVMYAGKLVEIGEKRDLFEDPLHPYTRTLMAAVPVIDPEKRKLSKEGRSIVGEPPNPVNMPPGCRFHPRCEHVLDVCRTREPPLVEVKPGHRVACWLYKK